MPGFATAASPAPVAADNGMVVTAQHLATDVGVDVLRAGGNAIDAAVAVGYARSPSSTILPRATSVAVAS